MIAKVFTNPTEEQLWHIAYSVTDPHHYKRYPHIAEWKNRRD